MSYLTSRPKQPALVQHMLLVSELWPGDPGPSELRVSQYDDDGVPHVKFVVHASCDGIKQAAELLKTGYVAAGVKYNVSERIMP